MVEEALRWEPPVAVQPRRSVAARSWDGIEVGPGEWTLFATAGANRAPAVFTDPGAFRPDRAQGTAPVLTFGAGPRYCLGAHLARAEMGAALDVLAETFPRLSLAVPPSEARVTGAILRGPKALQVSLGA